MTSQRTSTPSIFDLLEPLADRLIAIGGPACTACHEEMVMRWRTAHNHRAKVELLQRKEQTRRWRLRKLRRLVIRDTIKRTVRALEDLILRGSEANEATRTLSEAIGRFASGGIVEPQDPFIIGQSPSEFYVPNAMAAKIKRTLPDA